MFTIHPAGGSITPNQSQTVNIDCVAESLGKTEEVYYIPHISLHKCYSRDSRVKSIFNVVCCDYC